MLRLSQEIRGSAARGLGRHLRWPRALSSRRSEATEAPSPLLRQTRTRAAEPCEWGAALAAFCGGFRKIHGVYGKGASSWVVSPNLTNEEIAFSTSLARHGLGFPIGSTGAAPTLSAAWEAPEESDVVVVFGTGATASDSPLWQRLSCNRHQPRVIAMVSGAAASPPGATAHYAPRPGSTLTLLYGLANIIIASGWSNGAFIRERTSGFSDYAALVAHYTTDRVCAETGLEAERVWDLALAIGTGASVSFCGRPETSPRAESALRNLAVLTGQWGRAGTGLCLDLEPANALGAHHFGPTASLAQCEQAAQAGGLKALWIIATDAALPAAQTERWAALASKLEFLVVQGGPSTLAQQADLFLPTTGWFAKEGTRLDPSGRLRLLKPKSQPDGSAMTDFRLFQLIAQYWGCGAFFSRWSSPEAAFQLLKKTTAGAPFDFSAVADYAAIDAYRPSAEPAPPEATPLPFLFD